jgi:3-hydroxyisobutyrate dehydrogenase-like beta-hydroxyacid dehydrogenase
VTTVGLLHAGSMGAGVGRSLVDGGARVLTCLKGRSEATRRRAERSGLVDAGTLDDLVDRSDIVLSIVPPGVATYVAREVADVASGLSLRERVYVDANAIAPGTAAAVAAIAADGGFIYVDAGIIGGPPRKGAKTSIAVSGAACQRVADVLRTNEIHVHVLGDSPYAASALKVCYAAWTKVSTALLLDIRALARALEVEDPLLDQWARSQPDVLRRSEGANGVAARAWRWVDEMEEIAAAFEAEGLPGGAASAAAQVYANLQQYKDVATPPALDEVLDALLHR